MLKLIYIRAHGQFLPGDAVDLEVAAPERDKDGRYSSPPSWSEWYLAEPDRPEAVRAVAARKAADAARAKLVAPSDAAKIVIPPVTIPAEVKKDGA